MNKLIVSCIGAFCCGLFAIAMIGCENGSSEKLATGAGLVVTIRPETANLRAGTIRTVTFVARGGNSNYTWSVSDTTLGTITATGDSALYQSTLLVGTNYVIASDTLANVGRAVVIQK